MTAASIFVLLFFPDLMGRKLALEDPDNLNHGEGRMWVYLGRMTTPFLSYCLFPIIILGNNSKMTKTLVRELNSWLG